MTLDRAFDVVLDASVGLLNPVDVEREAASKVRSHLNWVVASALGLPPFGSAGDPTFIQLGQVVEGLLSSLSEAYRAGNLARSDARGWVLSRANQLTRGLKVGQPLRLEDAIRPVGEFRFPKGVRLTRTELEQAMESCVAEGEMSIARTVSEYVDLIDGRNGLRPSMEELAERLPTVNADTAERHLNGFLAFLPPSQSASGRL